MFIANTGFSARLTNNDYDKLAHIAGLYQESGSAADCSAGMLCVRGNRTPCEGFPSGTLNTNTFYMEAATAAATVDDVIYAADTYDNQLLSDGAGNNYAMGHRTLGLGIPAGRYGNYTRIDFDNQSVYRFMAGNVTINTTGDTYFTIADGLLTSATAKPTTAGTIFFTLVETGTETEGVYAGGTYYDLMACKVTV